MLVMKHSGLVFPNFHANLVNVSATLAEYLGQPNHHPTLPVLQRALNEHNYRNIVYLVVDGMGSRLMAKNLPVKSFLRRHQAQELTSVFPPTTVAATTTILSGLTPAEHGWFAWSVDFDGDVIELFANRNFYTKELTKDRAFAEHQLPYQYFFAQKPTDRTLYGVMPDIVNNSLRVPNYHEYHNWRQLTRYLRTVCHQPDRKFVYTYFADLDATMHHYGTTARSARKLINTIDRGLAKLVKQCPDTLFVITADHGQIDLTGYTPIYADPAITNCLQHPIALDPRGACFTVKPGQRDAFQKAFAKYANDYTLFPTQTLIDQGVFGGVPSPAYRKHLGDFIAIGGPTGKMLVFAPGKEYRVHDHLYRAHHTGLTPDEVFVPLIIVGNQDGQVTPRYTGLATPPTNQGGAHA